MGAMASQITGVSIVYSTVCSGADQQKHQSSVSLAFVRGIHRWPVNTRPKGPVTRKIMFPFDDVVMVLVELDCLEQPIAWPMNEAALDVELYMVESIARKRVQLDQYR